MIPSTLYEVDYDCYDIVDDPDRIHETLEGALDVAYDFYKSGYKTKIFILEGKNLDETVRLAKNDMGEDFTLQSLAGYGYGDVIWFDGTFIAPKFTTVKDIKVSGTSLCVFITKEVKMLGLDRGQQVRITIERIDEHHVILDDEGDLVGIFDSKEDAEDEAKWLDYNRGMEGLTIHPLTEVADRFPDNEMIQYLRRD